ncbi:MAG: NUDIX domain-containing protein [Paludibacter sp.]|nr:NUDIX domain-containing protein [Paludibacter sp.]
MQNEQFPIVDSAGNVIGKASRTDCHSGSFLLHPVVHLHVINSWGELYLQKRADTKDVQPGKWDTSVGGHIDYGETPEQALLREAREELGISGFQPEYLSMYTFTSKIESELVYSYLTLWDGAISPDPEEIEEGRFWTLNELLSAMGQNLFTPNFEHEFLRLHRESRLPLR